MARCLLWKPTSVTSPTRRSKKIRSCLQRHRITALGGRPHRYPSADCGASTFFCLMRDTAFGIRLSSFVAEEVLRNSIFGQRVCRRLCRWSAPTWVSPCCHASLCLPKFFGPALRPAQYHDRCHTAPSFWPGGGNRLYLKRCGRSPKLRGSPFIVPITEKYAGKRNKIRDPSPGNLLLRGFC